MSPASKSKSKDKATRAVKEQSKVSPKPVSASANGGNGVPAGAYNPVLGTFHTIETTSASLLGTQSNGRFRNMDETEEHSGSSPTGEFDSASNNSSCSGESEDQKEKTTSATPRIETIPGCDTDKRDKIRQKNERKHQRQKERRAQDLHERCSVFLMSRKLETLAQQLLQMGFSSERATMALIQNEGRLEESVAWLFEGGEESKQQVATNIEGGVNLKIDITDELAKMADMEVRFKCTKQEVQRAVVACEGDLEKVEQTLKVQKQEPPAAPPKLEESGDPASVSSFNSKMAVSAQSLAARTQVKGIASVSTQQQRKDDRDFNHVKSVATGVVSQESAHRNLQPSRRLQPKSAPLEKRPSSSSSATSHSLASPLQAAVPPNNSNKPEERIVMQGNEIKTNLQAGTLREPVIVMQRPQSINAKQSLPSTSLGISASPPASTGGWYSNGTSSMEMMKVANGGVAHSLPSLGLNGSSPQQFVPQNHFHASVTSPMESGATGWAGSWSSTGASSSSLAAPSSLGLFIRWGSSRSSSSSPVDWSTGGSTPRDYTSIDWSLDLTLLRPSVKSDRLSDTWSMGGKVARPVVNGGGVYVAGLQYGSLAPDSSSSAGSHEWTSPFAGKDLLRVPRQFVTSPSL